MIEKKTEVMFQRDFSELDLVVFHKQESAEKLARNAPIQRSDRSLVVYFGWVVLLQGHLSCHVWFASCVSDIPRLVLPFLNHKPF